jgi:hypothetical protein
VQPDEALIRRIGMIREYAARQACLRTRAADILAPVWLDID